VATERPGIAQNQRTPTHISHHNAIAARIDAQVNATLVDDVMQRTIGDVLRAGVLMNESRDRGTAIIRD
jgi:hypothetical protein